MKSNITITAILGIAIVFLLSGCAINAKSNHKKQTSKFGQVTKIERKHKGINAIKVSTAMDLVITQSDEEKVVIEANEELHQYIKTSVSGGTLNIRLETPRNMNMGGNNTIRAYVTVKNLNSLGTSGSTSTKIINLVTNSLNINTSGSSVVNFENVKSKNIQLILSGSTSLRGSLLCDNIKGTMMGSTAIRLTGSSNIANFTVSGSTSMQCKDFVINELTMKAAGSSSIQTTVNSKINIIASGSTVVTYYGNAIMENMQTSGSSIVKKR